LKYSIRGKLKTLEGIEIITLINKYSIWALKSNKDIDEKNNILFTFEVWLEYIQDKTQLFNELKPLVNQYGGLIDWHECSHDEIPQNQIPCEIAEIYEVI
jgi:hypothetical protein